MMILIGHASHLLTEAEVPLYTMRLTNTEQLNCLSSDITQNRILN